MIAALMPGALGGGTGGGAHPSLQPVGEVTLGAVPDERGDLRRYVNVHVDAEDCRRPGGLTTAVPDGAEIQVLPSVAGG